MSFINYYCILKSKDHEVIDNVELRTIYSINKFQFLDHVFKWLEDVNLDTCSVEIYRNDSSSTDV